MAPLTLLPDPASERVCVKPVVYVAALSYKRSEGVAELLRGLGELECPEQWDARFLIVDNDPDGSARGQVEQAMPAFGGRLFYVIEPEPGIPAARNRALREGIEGGGSLLCFLDDDETPQPDWLAELIAHRERSGAVLIGGPLRRTLSGQEKASPFQLFFGRSLIARRALAERRAERAAAAGKPVPINTSNWMCDLAIVREGGLWFDSAMRYSGGSDAAFYRAALKRGLRVSWCPTAIVSEPIAADRLTIAYQYRRSRAQGIVMARLRNEPASRTLLEQAPRAAVGLGLLFIPALGIASFATGLHLIAWAMGHLAHLRGKESALYERRAAAT